MRTVLYSEAIKIPAGNKLLKGELVLPENTDSIVLFSSTNGSNRFSSNNRTIAEILQENNIGTLLFDLLSPEEDRDPKKRTDISFLSKRLINASEFIQNNPVTEDLKIGYFASGMGAAAAIVCAADFGYLIKAIVSRGGKLELAMPFLPDVKASTLLLVGSLDSEGVESTRKIYQEIKAPKQLEIIKGASNSFEESGKAEKIAEITLRWFKNYLNGARVIK